MLAGGKALRMGGGDKCLLPLAGKTLLQHALERAAPQVDQLLLSANGNPLRYARTRLPVIPDRVPQQPGPLAGIYSAMCWMRENAPECSWLASFASDAPFLPENLVSELKRHISGETDVVSARSNGRLQPVFALWHIRLFEEIQEQLNNPEPVELRQWLADRERLAVVDFPHLPQDPFFNINTPQDLYAAEAMLVK